MTIESQCSKRFWPVLCLCALACQLAPLPGLAQNDNLAQQRKLLKKADDIASVVAKLRGLKQKRFIKRGVMNKDQIRKRLIKRIDEEYSADELRAEELSLKRLGLLPPDVDYKKLVIELLTEQIAGFYDPAERQLYIAGWQQSGVEIFDDLLLAHEIDHALQDQHFDLRKFMKIDKKNGDAVTARQALVEGDGMAIMVEYMLRNMGRSPWSNDTVLSTMQKQLPDALAGQLDKAPFVLREGLVFPYMNGLGFVAHFRKKHSWKRIDAIFRKPPLSTEHILHPDKYESYERPDEIKYRAIPALASYKRVYDGVNGELGWAILLRQHTGAIKSGAGKKKAEQAAAGWGGDLLAVYTPPGHNGKLSGVVAVSYSVWDEAADAIEFFELLSDSMASLSGGKARREGDSQVEYLGPGGDLFAAQRKGESVVMILGASASQTPAILQQVWQRWRVRRR